MIRKEYFRARNRAEFAHLTFRQYLDGSILDVGAGGSAEYFRSEIDGRYLAVDFSESRSRPDVYADLERSRLPFPDESFDTVLCFDALEHVDNPYRLLAELARLTRKYVVISLPNNWPGFLWSFVLGHNVTHIAGYGLPKEPRNPGDRHKWFFNLEEGENFVRHQAKLLGLEIVEARYIFERGNSALVYLWPYPLILAVSNRSVREKRPSLFLPFLVVKYGIALPFSYIEEVFKRLIWGWGRYRYLNLFCRQLWVVLQKT